MKGIFDICLQIREYLPERDFKGVVHVLNKLHNFMKMTSIGTVASSKGIKVQYCAIRIIIAEILKIMIMLIEYL